MRICFATNNEHKLEEVRQILGKRFELLSLKEVGFEGEIPETHETLEENSLEKAQFVYDQIKIPVFSDDSGLEIEHLDGRPGVHSAHYAGTREASANMDKVLKELGTAVHRQAQFRAVVTYIDQRGSVQFEGIVSGQITRTVQGVDGFGYDPIFIPAGYQNTFAELSADVKNEISHRKRSIEKLAKHLKSIR